MNLFIFLLVLLLLFGGGGFCLGGPVGGVVGLMLMTGLVFYLSVGFRVEH